MGAKGGPLWRHITFRLPALPTPPSHSLSQQQAVNQPQQSNPSLSSHSPPQQQQQQQPVNPPHTPNPTNHTHSHQQPKQQEKGTVTEEDAQGQQTHHTSSFFDYLSGFLESHRLGICTEAAEQLPFDFWCGLVGYLGFELKAECGGAQAHASPLPDASMFFADRMVAVDQLQGDVYVLAVHETQKKQQTQQQEQQMQQQAHRQRQTQQQQQQQGQQQQTQQQAHRQGQTEQQQQQQQTQQQGVMPQALALNQQLLSQQQQQQQAHRQGQQQQQQQHQGQQGNGHANGSSCDHNDFSSSCNGSSPSTHSMHKGGVPSSMRTGSGPRSSDRNSGHSSSSSSSSKAQAEAWISHTMDQLHAWRDDLSTHSPTQPTTTAQQQYNPSQQQQPTHTHSQPSLSPAAGHTCNGHSSQQADVQGPVESCAEKHRKDSIKGPGPFRLRHDRERYMGNVRACRRALYEGESYEVCLTTAMQRRGVPEPSTLYRTLRMLNPAPYGAWLQCGSSGPTICCSSPERFLRGGRGGELEAKPIKGTAPRVKGDAAADAAAAAALASSEKDRAENLMIVDLIRNDLSRVCEVGSVHVPKLMDIESFATVHQMVSTVRGLRCPHASVVDCIRAAFPGGSMTGAPKVRTMEIIDSLEGGPRSVYSGSVGYISLNDTFDLNIVIRTAVVYPDTQPQINQQQFNQQSNQQQQAQEHLNTQQQTNQQSNHHQQQQQQPHTKSEAPSHPQATACQSSTSGGSCGYQEGSLLSIGAGGAIVVQSGVEEEYEEMRLKARALMAAVGLCDAKCGFGTGQPAAVDDTQSL